MKYLILLLFTSISFGAFAQQSIELEDVKEHVGDSVKLKALIYGGRYLQQVKGHPTFLNVGGNFPNATLTLVIWENTRLKFTRAPEDFYRGKDVVITGKIILYKNRPEIIITDPKQIKAIADTSELE